MQISVLSPAFSKKSGGTLFLAFRGAWCVARGAWCVARGTWCVARGAWFRIFSRYLNCPLNSSHSFCPILLKLYRCHKDGLKIYMWFFQNPEIIFITFSHFELRHFLSSNITEVYREQVPCPLNSSHSFWPMLLKLYMGFKAGLKICMCIFSESWNKFLSLFRIFNLDIFWNPILQKHIGSRYLVPVTPTKVFVRSFGNFTGALRMVWRYACVFIESWNYFLSLFTHFELRHFFSSNITEVYREQVPCPHNSSHSFWPILLKLYMGFKDGLKICMWIFQNPEIFFFITFSAFWT